MEKTLSVAKKCKELKNELKSENKKTLVDAMLQWMSRGKPISISIGILAFFFLPLLIGLTLAVVLGELNRWQLLFKNLLSSPALFTWVYFGLFTATVSMVTANAYFKSIVKLVSEYMLDIVETEQTLNIIADWLDLIYNKKLALLTAIICGLVSAPIVISINDNAAGEFVGIGYTILTILFSAQSALFFGFLLGILLFAFRLKDFQLRLFEAEPANSEVVARLSSSLNSFVYLVAVYGGIVSFGVVSLKLPFFSSILIIFWITIIGVFLLCQYGLAQIIQRSKWKTLNKIQQEIIAIQRKNSTLTKNDKENLKWLFEYHDRVKMTRNSAFDWNSGLSFLNSLLLPLVGFLLGNFDKIFAFLR